MSETRKIIEGLTLLEAVLRLRKLANDTTDLNEKVGIKKAATVITNLGLEITEDKPDEPIVP